MIYGLIGEKLAHSFSKEIHAGIDNYEYELKELSPDELEGFIREKNFKGINVTIPYKSSVIPLLDVVSNEALKIGAVNTIVNRNGVLYGYNTDYFGAKALLEYADISVKGKKVLILGNGGTAKTLNAVTANIGAKQVLTVSRKASNNAITYSEAIAEHNDASVIINTTPVGMFPNEDKCAIDISAFNNLTGVVDVIYNPINTNFVRLAKKRKIKAVGGLYMLAGQAVYASSLFTGKQYGAEDIERVYKEVLGKKSNVVLIGMPSCGKSSVGKILAERLNKPFIDTDLVIEQTYGDSIPQIFAKYGEQYFRNLEKQVVKKVCENKGVIISTGGGVVLNEENVNNLWSNGTVFFLDRALEKLLITKDRPLSSSKEALEKRYLERYPIYNSVCDFVIDSNGTVEEVVEKILAVV